MSLLAELGRRNVIRVAIAYAVASWVLLQIVDVVTPILELPGWAPKLIFVVLAIGLMPVLIFSWAFELTPEGIKRESEVDRSGSISSQTGRKLNYIIIGALVVAVALLLLDRNINGPAADVPQATGTADSGPRSIAVLPFVNMSSDPEQEFFSDGITEEILNSLASVKQLKVAGRTSSFAFKGQNDDLRRIGDALGVSHILEGSVRKAGNQVRITAQLIQVRDGFHLWSETYDRELTDVFAIQDEISTEILRQLKDQLLPDAELVAESQRTTPEVYDLYLRAKQRMYTRVGTEIEKAVEELDRAIQLDPKYAPVFAQRGIATMLLSEQQYGSIPDDEADRRGKRFVDQALKLDENLAEAWAALGLYYTNTPGQADVAIDHLLKALSINPNLIDASNWLSIALQVVHDYRGSLDILADIAERDPLYRPAFSNAITTFNNFGEGDKAQALLDRIAAFNSDNPDLLLARAINHYYSGRNGEGLKQMELRRAYGNMSGLAQIYMSVGLLATMQFERILDEGSPFFQPIALYDLGRAEEAFAMAYEQAKSGNPGNLFYLLTRAGRDQELVNFLEERWPTLAVFADENPGDEFGYAVMSSIAFAYQRLGNNERFEEAMQFVEEHARRLEEQGIDNSVYLAGRAIELTVRGEIDRAFEYLELAVSEGWTPAGVPEEVFPEFSILADDPRFEVVSAAMLATVNRDRAVVGLPALDVNYQPVL